MSIVVFRNLDDGVDFQCVYPGKTTIGRGEHNHWSPPNQRAVSKVHAELEIAGTLENRDFSARLVDLDSRNGTFVGIGNPIEWEKVRGSHKLTVGDKIKFGTGGTPYQLLVVNPDQALALVAPRVLHVAAPVSKEDTVPRMATVEEVDENEPFEDDQDSRSLISRSSEDPKKNMTISIHYPTGRRDQQLQPVSIHVDPSGNCIPPWTAEKTTDNAPSSRREKQRAGSLSSRSSRSSSPIVEKQQKNNSSSSAYLKDGRKSAVSDSFSDPFQGGARNPLSASDTGPPVIKIQSPKLVESLDEDYDPVRFQRPLTRPAKYPVMSFSPPRDRGLSDIFNEVAGALDRKSAEYLSSWDPNSYLDQQQKENVENSRAAASRNIVLANKALAGVIPYSQWQNGNDKSGVSRFEHNQDATPGIETLELKKPPGLNPAELGEYVAVILGQGQTPPYSGPRLMHDKVSIERYAIAIPKAVTIEALGETLGDESSKSLIIQATCELEEIYNEIRVLIAPTTGDTIRIHSSPEETFEVVQLVVRNALVKLENVFTGSLFRVLDSENLSQNSTAENKNEVCSSFIFASSILDKLERLFSFQIGHDIARILPPHSGSLLNIKDIMRENRHLSVSCSVLYSILQELSILQHNLIILDKILDTASSSDIRKSNELLRSMNAEMRDDGFLSLKAKKEEPVFWTSTEFDRNPEKCLRVMILFFSRWKRSVTEKNLSGKCREILSNSKFKCLNRVFQMWRRTQVGTAFNRAAAKEISAKDELIQSLQSQLRKSVGDLHEFESRSDATSMYVAERALNRELTKTNYELRKQLYASQQRFLEYMNIPESELRPQLAQENLQDILKLSRENSFLREKINLYLGKPEVSATRVPVDCKPVVGDEKLVGVRPRSKSPPNGRYRRLKVGRPSTTSDVPVITRNIAMKLVLHEIKRLSSSFMQVKQAQESLRSQLAEETQENEQLTMALHLLQERFLEKERGLDSLHRILLDRFGRNETKNIFQALDRAGWCNLFSNSMLQLIDPPVAILDSI